MTATSTLRFAGGAQGFNWLPVFVAEERGLFEQQGLKVELLRLGSVEQATAAVRDGSADLAITPPEGAIANYLAGGSLRLIGSNSERLPMSLVARPGITDLESLRGKRIGTSSLTEGTSMYTRRMLAAVGLQYPADYDFVFAGVHTARWAALQNDEIDAAPQPAPWNFLAERAGYSILGEVADTLPEIVFAGVIGSEPWLDANGDTVRRLIAALSKAHDFINDPANDAVSLAIYQRVTTPEDEELARRGFEYTRDLGMWPTGLQVSETALAVNVDVMIEAGLVAPEHRAKAAGVFDPRFTESV
jgi:ABC-type nitrate/sulfonate/bicarbonate transport system substrate-binding protein